MDLEGVLIRVGVIVEDPWCARTMENGKEMNSIFCSENDCF